MSHPHSHLGDPGLREVAVPVATLWRSPEAPRNVDATALRDLPNDDAWVDSMDTETRLGLHGRIDTQLLMGEPVLVLDERDGWSRVAALWQPSSGYEHGYQGWVRSAHLASHVPTWRGAAATVITRFARCSIDGAETSLSFGTLLRVADLAQETATVLLPGNRRGEISLDDLRLTHKRQRPTYGADDLLSTARQFLELRYLWGGTSAWGLDCSGLVHLTLRSFGVIIPRDAHDLAVAQTVDPIPRDEVRPGDLYFFAAPGAAVSHVGFVTSPLTAEGHRRMLHAPEGGELVEDAPLAQHRVETLVSAGRVRKPDTGHAVVNCG